MYATVNGVKLHYVRKGTSDGPLVILLHGFPQFWYCWRHQIDALAEAGFDVVAPDQRGYNLSDKPKGVDAYNVDVLADDIAALIRSLGRKKAFIAGHDWGGIVAWWLALRHPDLVEKLVIVNVPHPVVMRRELKKNPRQLMRSWYVFFFQFPMLPELALRLSGRGLPSQLIESSARPGTFSKEDLARYRESWAQPGALTAMVNWYRAMFRAKPSQPSSPRITQPTLLIWGTGDKYLGRELTEPSIKMCDNGRLELFENATHWVAEEEPQKVTELLRDFFGASRL